MNSDFSKSRVGDWAWTIKDGWSRVAQVDVLGDFPIQIASGMYTTNGKYLFSDKFPSAFLVPPVEFDVGPPPCEFEEEDKVLVWNNEKNKWRARFSHYEDNDDNKYHCYSKGDRWTSYGDTIGWKYCKRGEEK